MLLNSYTVSSGYMQLNVNIGLSTKLLGQYIPSELVYQAIDILDNEVSHISFLVGLASNR